jgi:hypothetical protein
MVVFPLSSSLESRLSEAHERYSPGRVKLRFASAALYVHVLGYLLTSGLLQGIGQRLCQEYLLRIDREHKGNAPVCVGA